MSDNFLEPNLNRDLPVLPLNRLKKRSQFLAMRHAGRKSCAYFTVQAKCYGWQNKIQDTHDTSNQAPRIGFTVTKKVGNAVVRNRIKRRLRAVAGICHVKGLFESATDYVVIARRDVLDADFNQLQLALAQTVRYATKNAQQKCKT